MAAATIWASGAVTSGGSSRVPIASPSVSSTARSITFLSSRTLPGQAYALSIACASGAISRTCFPNSRLKCAVKCLTSGGMSSRRSRSGGSVMGMTRSR